MIEQWASPDYQAGLWVGLGLGMIDMLLLILLWKAVAWLCRFAARKIRSRRRRLA